MISNVFEAAGHFGSPVKVDKSTRLAVGIMAGTWSGTMALQKIIPPEADPTYPAHDDSRWQTVASYVAAFQDQVAFGDGCWYRWYCSAWVSGSITAQIGVA